MKIKYFWDRIKYEITKEIIFKRHHGYKMSIKSPTTFSEKIFYRKYYGNNDFMAVIADKLKVREYVRDKVGEEFLIPLISVHKKLQLEDIYNLPNEFIIKSNHGSGSEHLEIVRNKKGLSTDELSAIIEKMNLSIDSRKGAVGHELFYERIERRIIIEKLLRCSDGKSPNDYKFHVFKNGPTFIQVDSGRYVDHKRTIYNELWEKENFKLNPKYDYIEESEKPMNFDKMLKIAKKLAEDFDYVRVDLYNIEGKIFFGELTQTHGNGLEKFEPSKFDYIWGSFWDLDVENKTLYK
ncbi:hypothetical protein C4G80_RS07065 [Vibrio parahaemolyticus]|nr:hypothetical protein [Vibrio parahaemolyticus]